MAEVHIIRLRGPWELQPLAHYSSSGELVAVEPAALAAGGCRVEVPGDWQAVLGRDFLGCARYTRRFNLPTNLTTERVWLVCERIDPRAIVTLNGQPIGPTEGLSGAARLDITGFLQLHNVLALDVTLSPDSFSDPAVRADRANRPGGLPGEVRLEIG